jgi:2-dehydro-3-deoxyphosphogluconate aldolase/(4S)-4-hydroxy-2-oxoglutarate aldolase
LILKDKKGKHKMSYIAEKFEELGVVPVVVLDDAKDALPLAKALMEGGLPCAEVTFRTQAAQESIRLMAEEYPDMLVGAGTVLTTKQVDEAMDAGAKFIVSPGFDPEIVDYCQKKGIEIFPGCVSPSEVAQAVKKGLKVVKFFPAEQAGGIDMIKAMAAPYHELKFMPTGGINPNNLEKYLKFDKILCCGGSWMVKGNLVKAGDFDKIEQLTKEAKELAQSIR